MPAATQAMSRVGIAMAILSGVAILTFLLSGKYYLHYIYTAIFPAVIVVMTRDFRRFIDTP